MTSAPHPRTLRVCTHMRLGTGSCGSAGGAKLARTLRQGLARRGLDWTVEEATCLGLCRHGPNLKAAPDGPVLHGCDPNHADTLIGHLLTEWKPRG